jgi:hypothetical protein
MGQQEEENYLRGIASCHVRVISRNSESEAHGESSFFDLSSFFRSPSPSLNILCFFPLPLAHFRSSVSKKRDTPGGGWRDNRYVRLVSSPSPRSFHFLFVLDNSSDDDAALSSINDFRRGGEASKKRKDHPDEIHVDQPCSLPSLMTGNLPPSL